MADKGKYFIFKCFYGARCFIDDKGEKVKEKTASFFAHRTVRLLRVAAPLRELCSFWGLRVVDTAESFTIRILQLRKRFRK